MKCGGSEISFFPVAYETEIKVQCADTEALRRQLADLGAELSAPRHFEENVVLDFADGRLRGCGSLMRVRIAGGAATVTFKGPPVPAGPFKKRAETETSVGDGMALLGILSELGMAIWFRYQKYREEYHLAVPGHAGSVHVTIDETPIGNYVEIEGEEDAIREAARRLGIGETSFLRDSYYALYVKYCERQGRAPGHMIFAESEGFMP